MLCKPRGCSITLIVSAMLAFPLCYADEKPLTYDRITLAADASDEVRNDTLVATLSSQREGSDAGMLADEVNGNIRWALEQVKNMEGLKAQTLGYHTTPIYRNQKLSGWRVRQSIRLESKDATRLSALIGTLQTRLTLQSIGYSVSPESRRTAEDRLIKEALSLFTSRAELITKELGRMAYRLVEMNVSTSGPPVRPVPFGGRAVAMEAAVTPPALQAGTQTVQITVNGTIELEVK